MDIPFYYLILSCMTVILFSFHTGNLLTSSNLTAVVCAPAIRATCRLSALSWGCFHPRVGVEHNQVLMVVSLSRSCWSYKLGAHLEL